jgi:predicted lipoprotein with Yx(FWY)xxD motif
MTRRDPAAADRASTSDRAAHLDPWQLLRYVGGALLIATGAIHLDLYLTGYNTIPTIGALFLFQVIGAFALATATIEYRSRLLSAAGAGFFISTLVGYLLALRIGLFGFREVRTTSGVLAGVIEIVGFAALAAFALHPVPERLAESPPPRRLPRAGRSVLSAGRWLTGAVTLLAVISFGLSLPSSVAASTNGRSTVVIKLATIHGIKVLTNERGYTLYWFAPDSPTTSRCSGTCAAYWPPVIGSSAEGGGAGSFASLTRGSGSHQITYNGHPLYTYVGDSAPGQANGNHIRLNGGWWYEMKAST